MIIGGEVVTETGIEPLSLLRFMMIKLLLYFNMKMNLEAKTVIDASWETHLAGGN